MKQYYVLSQDPYSLRYWIIPAENAEQLVNKFKTMLDVAGSEILNFVVRIPGEPEPEWFKRREPDRQYRLPFEEVSGL